MSGLEPGGLSGGPRSPELHSPLRTWMGEFLALHGAETEESDSALSAILPIDLAKQIGWSEFERFTFIPGTPGRFVSYESGVLDALRPVVEAAGTYANVRLPTREHKSQGFDKLVAEELALDNGIYRYEGAQNVEAPYLIAQYRATAMSEEKRDALLTVAVNTNTGADAGRLVQPVFERLGEASRIFGGDSASEDVTRWAGRLGRSADAAARACFAEFEKSLSRRLARETERLTGYYGAIQEEIRRKIEKKRLAGEELTREEARIEATARELERKLADQHARYALEIRIRPVAILRVSVGVTMLRLTLQRRKRSREIALSYSHLLHQIEPPACEGCHASPRPIWLCDDEVHLLCSACVRCPECGKQGCRACKPGGCEGVSCKGPERRT